MLKTFFFCACVVTAPYIYGAPMEVEFDTRSADSSAIAAFPTVKTFGPYSFPAALRKKLELEKDDWICFVFKKGGAWWVQAYKD